MKKILFAFLLFLSHSVFSQNTSPVTSVTTKVQLQIRNFGSAGIVFVSDSNAFYSICSPCTVDNVYVISGASGKKWKKVEDARIIALLSAGGGGSTDTTSLSNRINGKVNIADTSSMLSKYLRKVDTTGMLTPYLRKVDTAALSTRINAKQNTLSLTTTGSSGAATLVGSTLNIPQYTGGSGGGIPVQQLTDTSTAIRAVYQMPPEKSPYNIYKKISWATADDLVPIGTTSVVLNGSKLDLSGGTGAFSNYATIGGKTLLPRWQIKIKFKMGTVNGTSYGIGIGVHSANPNLSADVLGRIGTYSGNFGDVYINTSAGTQLATGSGTTVATGDTIELTGTLTDSVFVFTYKNITAGTATTTVSYTFSTLFAPFLPNTGYFSIYEFGGTHQVQSLEVTSTSVKNPNILLLGDSKTHAYYASSFAGRYGSQLNNVFPSVVNVAGGGDRTVEIKDRIAEILELRPAQVIMSGGSNDIRFGRTVAQTIATYDSIVNYLTAANIKVYHIVFPEDSTGDGIGLTSFKNYIAATYPSTYIPVWDSLSTNNILKTIYKGDNVHFNQAGNNKIYQVIIASGLLKVTSDRKSQFRTSDGNVRFVGDSLYLASGSSAGGGLSGGSANTLVKWTGPTTASTSIVQDNGSTIGVGGAPNGTYKLSVNGPTQTIGHFASTGSGSGYQVFNRTGDAAAWLIYSNAGSFEVFDLATNTTKLVISPTLGAVGIPSIDASNKFSVTGNSSFTGTVYTKGSTSGYIVHRRDTDVASWGVLSLAGNLDFYDVVNLQSRFYATPTGLLNYGADVSGSYTARSVVDKGYIDSRLTVLTSKADLVGGLVPTSQLPSSIDAILEYANFAALPGTGLSNKIYITTDNNKQYRWTGTQYVEIGVGAVPTSRTFTINGVTQDISTDRTWNVGTVTTASVVGANGFAGSVSSASTAPAITISTTISGIIKGNGSAISAAASGTDYSLGTSGLATGFLKSTTSTGALSTVTAINLTTDVTAALPIGNGGTGQTTKAAAYNALTPITTTGDLVIGTGANTASRLAGPTTATKQFLTSQGTGILANQPVWGTIAAGDVPTLNQNTTGTAAGLSSVLATNMHPALTGDITTPSGSVATTLATVNSNTGSWGTATQVPTFTVNGKGLITAASHTSIQIAESQVTSLAGDLTARELTANKDAGGGYVGLTSLKINFKNVANTFTSFFTNTNTAGRTYTFQDRDGTIADNTDLSLKANLASPTFTGTVTLPTGTVGVTQTAANNSTALATTAYVDAADALKANLASPTFTGTPTLPTGTIATTQTAGNNTTALATTAFVATSFAPLASPTFTGTPTLPTGTIAVTQTAATSTTQIATTAFVENAITRKSYNIISEASASHTAARVAGTYAMTDGDAAAISGTGTLYPVKIIRITGADYPTVDGIATKLNLQIALAVNDVAPTGNYTFGLYPITRPATSGGIGLDIYTLGTVVTGSTVLFTAPAADGLLTGASGDFAIPADGFYVVGFVSTAAVAASSHLHMVSYLRYRNN
jgi:hypothetical protein